MLNKTHWHLLYPGKEISKYMHKKPQDKVDQKWQPTIAKHNHWARGENDPQVLYQCRILISGEELVTLVLSEPNLVTVKAFLG